jgi:hypothetical protein
LWSAISFYRFCEKNSYFCKSDMNLRAVRFLEYAFLLGFSCFLHVLGRLARKTLILRARPAWCLAQNRKGENMNAYEITHRWANQTETRGRGINGQCSNASYEGKKLFSYATCIAELIPETKAGPICLLSSTSYSVTTSKHQQAARGALLPAYTVLEVPGEWHGRRLSHMIENKAGALMLFNHHIKQAGVLWNTSKRCRSEWRIENTASRARFHLNQAAIVKKVASLRHKIQAIDGIAETIAKHEAAAKKQAAKKERARLRAASEALANWLAGNLPTHYRPHTEFIEFRLINGGADIETSRGAVFPVDHAKRALAIAYKVRNSGQSWQANGKVIHCGHYSVDKIDAAGIVAGCHRMQWKQIDAFCKAQGWDL